MYVAPLFLPAVWFHLSL